MSPLYIVTIILEVLIISLHSLGIHLLTDLNKRTDVDIQRTYIISLSATELLATVLFMLQNVMDIIGTHFGQILDTLESVQQYMSIFSQITVRFVFYMNMVAITLDKLMVVFLNLRYHLYWNIRRARILLVVIWPSGICLFCSTVLVHEIAGRHFDKTIEHVIISFDFIFMFVASISNSYLFHKYRKTRVSPATTNDAYKTRQNTIWTVFRRSRFFVSVLLITSFLCFIVIPDLVDYFVRQHKNKQHMYVERRKGVNRPDQQGDNRGILLLFLYHIAFLSDSCTYIFMQPNVRNLLWRKIQNRRGFLINHVISANVPIPNIVTYETNSS